MCLTGSCAKFAPSPGCATPTSWPHFRRCGWAKSIAFAMEYVPGLDLARILKTSGPLPISHACFIAHQTVLGLQHAHDEGLVHRDIKPGNLMLTHQRAKAMIKILDFGIAKLSHEEKIDTQLTLHGQTLGTPDYVAPEQIINAASADIRSDIYSLGSTLYHLLTGRPPFQTGSVYDTYRAHISRDAELVNVVRPDVPAELAAIVAKMMAKDPSQRFQSPKDVSAVLKPMFGTSTGSVSLAGTEVPQTETASAAREPVADIPGSSPQARKERSATGRKAERRRTATQRLNGRRESPTLSTATPEPQVDRSTAELPERDCGPIRLVAQIEPGAGSSWASSGLLFCEFSSCCRVR